MRPNFFIKYRGINASNDSAVDLVALGESIIGFDALIKDIFEISKINGEVSVSATKTRDGSLIVDILVTISNIANAIPFERVEDLLNFLRIVDHNAWELANNFFNDLTHAHRTLNDYFAANPLDYTLACSFVAYLIGRAKKHKQKPDLDDLPKDYAIALHKAIKARKFKKAISPLIENEVTSIEVSDDRDFGRESTAVIDVSNFENYLSEDEETILPDYENGKVYLFTGAIVSIQCIRGETMKIRIHGFHKKYRDLVAFPEEGKTTEDYMAFYGKDKTILIKAMIERSSLYQKPKIHIREMSLQNQPLFE